MTPEENSTSSLPYFPPRPSLLKPSPAYSLAGYGTLASLLFVATLIIVPYLIKNRHRPFFKVRDPPVMAISAFFSCFAAVAITVSAAYGTETEGICDLLGVTFVLFAPLWAGPFLMLLPSTVFNADLNRMKVQRQLERAIKRASQRASDNITTPLPPLPSLPEHLVENNWKWGVKKWFTSRNKAITVVVYALLQVVIYEAVEVSIDLPGDCLRSAIYVAACNAVLMAAILTFFAVQIINVADPFYLKFETFINAIIYIPQVLVIVIFAFDPSLILPNLDYRFLPFVLTISGFLCDLLMPVALSFEPVQRVVNRHLEYLSRRGRRMLRRITGVAAQDKEELELESLRMEGNPIKRSQTMRKMLTQVDLELQEGGGLPLRNPSLLGKSSLLRMGSFLGKLSKDERGEASSSKEEAPREEALREGERRESQDLLREEEEFDLILGNLVLLEHFTEFTQKNWSVENVLFYKGAESFKKHFNEPGFIPQRMAEELVGEFVGPNSPLEINLESEVRKEIMDNFKKGTISQDSFEKARIHIYLLMKKDSYEKWRQTKEFVEAMKLAIREKREAEKERRSKDKESKSSTSLESARASVDALRDEEKEKEKEEEKGEKKKKQKQVKQNRRSVADIWNFY